MGHITFVHGIANKPEPEVLLKQWLVALYDNDGVDLDELDVTCSMVYWADLLYPDPALAGGGMQLLPGHRPRNVDDEIEWKQPHPTMVHGPPLLSDRLCHAGLEFVGGADAGHHVFDKAAAHGR